MTMTKSEKRALVQFRIFNLNQSKISSILCFLAVVTLVSGFFLLCGCGAHFSDALSSKSIVYRSDEYIFYRLQQGENPSTLAERFLGGAHKGWIIEEANVGVSFERGGTVLIPLNAENKGGIRANGYQLVPILCYHRFDEGCGSKLCIPGDVFEQQMKYLKENGYQTISAQMLLDFLSYRGGLPEKSVMITIDDGYRSVYNVAYPILKKYGFTAIVFVYTDFVGISKSAITWDQLKEMKANGFEIGSHTVSHSDLSRKLEGEDNRAYLKRVKRELGVSKKIIDKKLNQNTTFIAYPYGRQNKIAQKIAHRVGYELAATVKSGGNPFFSDSLTLNRRQILSRDKKVFISRLNTLKNF
jgi:peptidoglycan/xylan/chitin deacetylase (PgdA/CDA1 family)